MGVRSATRGVMVVFLFFLLAASIAHAQSGNDTSPSSGNLLIEDLTIALSDDMYVSEAASIMKIVAFRSIVDSISVSDSPPKSDVVKVVEEEKQSEDNFSIKDSLVIDLLPSKKPVVPKGSSQVSIGDTIRFGDSITLSGAVDPRASPFISVQAGSPAVFSPDGDGVDDTVQIAFESNAEGTYEIRIHDAEGTVVSSLTGPMTTGKNSVTWNGTDSSGNVVAAGTYAYYISAQSEGGVREPPRDGDGRIVVTGQSGILTYLPELDYTLILAAVAVAAGGTGLLLFSRRRKELVLYLPAAASDVIEEIKQKYPSATVENFIESAQGGSKLYKGVKIENPGKEDEGWFTEIINKAKKLAGVDSVNVSYRGKVRAI